MSERPAPKQRPAPLHFRAPWEVADVAALQALDRGEATPEQQKRALKWVVEVGAQMYECHYLPGDRDTAFSLGRAFVGQQVVKLLRLNMMTMRRVGNG